MKGFCAKQEFKTLYDMLEPIRASMEEQKIDRISYSLMSSIAKGVLEKIDDQEIKAKVRPFIQHSLGFELHSKDEVIQQIKDLKLLDGVNQGKSHDRLVILGTGFNFMMDLEGAAAKYNIPYDDHDWLCILIQYIKDWYK